MTNPPKIGNCTVPIDRTILATCIQGHGGFPKGTALKIKRGHPQERGRQLRRPQTCSGFKRADYAAYPKTGDVWPEADRKLWRQLPEGSFKLIYKDAPEVPPRTSDNNRIALQNTHEMKEAAN
jgi:hypothetical protein